MFKNLQIFRLIAQPAGGAAVLNSHLSRGMFQPYSRGWPSLDDGAGFLLRVIGNDWFRHLLPALVDALGGELEQ